MWYAARIHWPAATIEFMDGLDGAAHRITPDYVHPDFLPTQ